MTLNHGGKSRKIAVVIKTYSTTLLNKDYSRCELVTGKQLVMQLTKSDLSSSLSHVENVTQRFKFLAVF